MKIQLHAVDGHHTFVELKPMDRPEGYHCLEFTTVFERSRQPHERQAYRLLMSPECLEKFKQVLNQEG